MTATPRTMAHRSLLCTIEEVEGVHVATSRRMSEFTELTTHCGIESPEHYHRTLGTKPLAEATCAECVEFELAVPFEHETSIGRVQRGRGALRGAGMQYGTRWSCSCGAGGQINVAPSSGGTKSAEAAAAKHLAEIEAAEAARKAAFDKAWGLDQPMVPGFEVGGISEWPEPF